MASSICEIACQTEKIKRKVYYYPEAIKRYREKLKKMNDGKLYTSKNAQYMRTYRAKLKQQKQDQKELEIKLKN